MKLHSDIFYWSIPAVLVGGAIASGLFAPLPPWVWMWVLAGSMWVSFKMQSYLRASALGSVEILYFFNIGMETAPFREKIASRETLPFPFASVGFFAVGLILIFTVVPLFENSVSVGWVGLIAMLCLLHFGSFAIIAWIWRLNGYPVHPIMAAPWRAKTLGEFWGPRWNRAFSDWARVWVFRPLVRKFGVGGGTLAGFIASGFAHELVISLPARAGFGLPTTYFLLQGAGVLIQRRFRWTGQTLATLAWVLVPAPLLFHESFCRHVFAPMIETLLSAMN